MLSGGTQRRAFVRNQSQKMKLFEWESNPQSVAFTLTCLCQFAANGLKYQKRQKEVLYKFTHFFNIFSKRFNKKVCFYYSDVLSLIDKCVSDCPQLADRCMNVEHMRYFIIFILMFKIAFLCS